jgi:hypothetical protein
MSTAHERITLFLAHINAEGRSSPAGMHWQKFHDLLIKQRQIGQGEHPTPLIWAVASESDASKHDCLANQLEWAEAHGCPDAAVAFLDKLPPENWNTSSLAQWKQDSY